MNSIVKKVIIALLIAALVCGGIYGGLMFYKRSRGTKVSVYPVSEVIVPAEYFFDESQSYGSVAADRIQSVFITGTQNVKEVLVKEGQEVKKGDPLISYDTTLTAIQLEKAENDLAQQELALSNSQRDLERLEQLRPSSESDDSDYSDFFPEDFGEEPESEPEQKEEEVTYEPQPTGVRLSGKGTAESPYIYLWSTQDALTNEQLLAMFTSDGRIHYVGDTGTAEATELIVPTEAFISRLGRGLGLMPLVVYGDEDIVEVTEDVEIQEVEEILPDVEEEEFNPDEDIVEESVEIEEGEVIIEETPEEDTSPGTEDGEDWVEVPSEENPQEIITTESTPDETETTNPYAWLDDCPNEVYVILEMHEYNNVKAPIEQRYGMHLIRVGHEVATRLFNPDSVSSDNEENADGEDEGDDDYTPINGEEDLEDDFGDFDFGDDYDYGYDDEDEEDDEAPSINESSIDFDAHYTAKEIEEMKREKAKEVRDDTISYKMSEINLRDMRKEMADGFVRSNINGVIKTVRQPDEAYKNSEAVVVVSGGGGYSVSISVSELELNTLTQGQDVEVSSFANEDIIFDGKIDTLGDYPAGSLDGWSTGNPNVSYYPCKVTVSEDAELREGDYVSVKYSANTEEKKASYYIEAMYVRHDSSGRYVYVEGKDGKLERRNIVTGKAPDSYTVEIRGGLSPDDQIAFPYGSNIKEGAVVERASIDELY